MTPTPTPPSTLWQRLSQASWQRRVVPGLTVIGAMVVLRLLGMFQEIEWNALDSFLRWRPAETTSDRLLIVGINEADIQQVGTYPIPDEVLESDRDRKSTRLNSSHSQQSRMPSSA